MSAGRCAATRRAMAGIGRCHFTIAAAWGVHEVCWLSAVAGIGMSGRRMVPLCRSSLFLTTASPICPARRSPFLSTSLKRVRLGDLDPVSGGSRSATAPRSTGGFTAKRAGPGSRSRAAAGRSPHRFTLPVVGAPAATACMWRGDSGRRASAHDHWFALRAAPASVGDVCCRSAPPRPGRPTMIGVGPIITRGFAEGTQSIGAVGLCSRALVAGVLPAAGGCAAHGVVL